MSDAVSSLLTRTQRDRIRSGFADVERAKRRRDQRKIRTRIAAGIDDFELLVDYPDRQLELAFEERADETLEARLADAYLTVERIRILRGIDRDALRRRASARRDAVATDETPMLAAVPVRTTDEWRDYVADDLAAEYQPSRWKRLSDALLKIGLALLVFVSGLAVVAPDFTNGYGSLPGIVGASLLTVGLGIVGVRGLKYDLVPATRTFVADPSGALRTAWDQF
ncbi:hypothetical protein NDI56_10385 [Haloarcula sp. S1CR25-12]|uniref:Uncharacterized protein n=1 Tax=Haloarcula saliterrae TaxID=2950534 RepID=A0ABU2FC04_9EURY|nr:hypothetical protein [Haloarcula sp. S1CR25-12]MDS0259798.1 hypothetical protein [Haloarcula sp. S1CR25-12]